jgi:hypothetical protein
MSELRRVVTGLIALLACWWTTGALGHTGGTTFIALGDNSAGPSLIADLAVRDLHYDLGLDADGDARITFGEVESAAERIEQLMFQRLAVSAGGQSCRATSRAPLETAQRGDGPYVRLALTMACGEGPVGLDYSRGFATDPAHRVLIAAADGSAAMLTESAPAWSGGESPRAMTLRFLRQGVLHLVGGYDHLAFLLALLIATVRVRRAQRARLACAAWSALGLISAFTLAHSFTLALAALGVVQVPAGPVEVVIALSVIVASLANLRRPAPVHGWWLAFSFGLIHGLGFANALVELLNGQATWIALASFNAGIEIGQVVVAAAVVPMLWWALRSPAVSRFGVPAASLLIAMVGAGWLLERL